MTDPFTILGIASTATRGEVETRWRSLASTHHPDKGGNAEEFIECRKAYKAALQLARDESICPLCNGRGKITKPGPYGYFSVWCQCKKSK